MLHLVNEKPHELNVMSTAARRPLGGANHNNTRMQDAQPLPMTMPYPYYPSPHMYYPMPQQQWAPQPVPPICFSEKSGHASEIGQGSRHLRLAAILRSSSNPSRGEFCFSCCQI